jgi:hypothetical protein
MRFKTGTLIYSTKTQMVWKVKKFENGIYTLKLIANPINGYSIGNIDGFTYERTHSCCVILTEEIKAHVV